MHLQSLKLLCPTVLEHMHLQENTLFDLDPLCSQGHVNVTWYTLHYLTYANAKIESATFKDL